MSAAHARPARAVLPAPRSRDDRTAGFTLVELLIALAIVATLLVIAFGGLRVVLAAVQRGDERIAAHQHVRSVTALLTRAVGAAHPYQGPMGDLDEQRLLFVGEPSSLAFVTQAPPFPLAPNIAFTAVILSHVPGEGLVIRERALPNYDPFKEAVVVLRDPAVTALRFRYMDELNGWQTEWEESDAPPTAIEISVAMTINGRPEPLPPMVIPLRVTPE